MKRVHVAAAAVAMVVLTAGGAFAAPPLDVQVDVTATVTQKCDVTANGLLDIAIDPVGGLQAFTATQPQAKCTKTKAAATAAVSASSTGSGNVSNTGSLVGALQGTLGETDIPYTFTFNNTVVGNGFGAAADVNFNIAGSVAAAAAEAAEYGSYTDTVIMTLTY